MSISRMQEHVSFFNPATNYNEYFLEQRPSGAKEKQHNTEELGNGLHESSSMTPGTTTNIFLLQKSNALETMCIFVKNSNVVRRPLTLTVGFPVF